MQKENNNKNVFINYKICKLISDMRINIIIPAYNEEENIGETLHSLINQSIPIHKIIIINDNSTDGTQKIIDSFTTKFSPIAPYIKFFELSITFLISKLTYNEHTSVVAAL